MTKYIFKIFSDVSNVIIKLIFLMFQIRAIMLRTDLLPYDDVADLFIIGKNIYFLWWQKSVYYCHENPPKLF